MPGFHVSDGADNDCSPAGVVYCEGFRISCEKEAQPGSSLLKGTDND